MTSVFDPITLAGHVLPSRAVFTAHTVSLSNDGVPGTRAAAYYAQRAENGVGLIVMEPIPVLPNGGMTPQNYNLEHPNFISGLTTLVDTIHAYGTMFINQLFHMGTNADPYSSDSERWGPSAMSGPGWSDITREMDHEDIAVLVEAFTNAAKTVMQSGSDGIDCMFAYDTLVDQFMDPKRNQRTDEYGGTLTNRCRLALKVLQAVRVAIGPGKILGLTITAAMGEHLEAVRYLCENVKVDYVGVGNGNYESLHLTIPPMEVAPGIGRTTSSPVRRALHGLSHQPVVIAEGRIRDVATANSILESNEADLVGMTRALIADPEILRTDDPARVRPCVGYNLCIARRLRKYPVACVQNPLAGNELDGPLLSTVNPKRVMVVGGGLAGLEAARVAAERGHHVTLVEQSGSLGGQAKLIAQMPLQSGFAELINWRVAELAHLRVAVQRNTRADELLLAQWKPDQLIVATGSVPHHLEGTIAAADILEDNSLTPTSVVVLDSDGHRKGIGTAEWLAARGHQVTLVSLGIPVAYMLDGLKVGPLAVARIRDLGVQLIEGHRLTSVHERQVTLARIFDGTPMHLEANIIVDASGHRPLDELVHTARKLGITARAIGDARSPRLVEDAIRDGYRIAAAL